MPTFKERLEAIEKKIANGEPIKDDLLYEINLIKQEFKEAGVDFNFTDKVIDELTSEKNIQTYIKSKEVADTIAISDGLSKKVIAKEKEAAEEKRDLQINVTGPLARCVGYFFNPGDLDDPKVLAENQKITKLMNSPKGINTIFRSFYDEMLKTDEGLLYLNSYDDKLEYLSTNTRRKLMYYELINAFIASKNAGYLDFTPYEIKQFKQLIPSFQEISGYKQEISTKGNIMNFLMPELGNGMEYMKLIRYYSSKKEPEKLKFCNNAITLVNDNITGTQYSEYAIDIFKEKGLIGNGYELIDCYDEKGEVIESGKGTIANELSKGQRDYVRFVRHSHDEKGLPIDKEVIVTREEILKRANAEKIQKLDSEVTETLDGLFGSPVTAGTEFDSDPLKAASQKACLIYQLRRKNDLAFATDDEKLAFCNSVLKNINEGKDEVYNFIQTKSQSASLALISDISSDDKSRSTKAYEKYKSIRNIIQNEASVNAPGQSVLDGMLAPKPDTSKLIPPEKLTNATQEQRDNVADAYKKINGPDLVLPIPNGWTEHDVSMLTLCTLLKDPYMKACGEMAFGKEGSTLPNGLTLEQYGRTNFLENMLSGDDRYNMQVASTQAPQARKEAKRALDYVVEGRNFGQAAGILKSGFVELRKNLRSFSSMDSNASYSSSKYMLDIYELLQKPEFEGLVEFSKDDLEAVKLAKAERKLLTEMISYEKEIQQIYDEKSFGDPSSNPRKDEHFNDLVKNYFARKLYFAKVRYAKNDLNKELSLNANKNEVYDNQQNKRLTIVESNLISDPEGYIDSLKEQITSKNVPAFGKFTNASRWLDVDDGALINIKMNSKSSAEYIFTEKAITKDFLTKEYISKIPVEKSTKKLRSLLENLPCMKDELPDEFKDPEARAAEYERVAKLLEELDIGYEEISEDPSMARSKKSSTIGADLKSIASKLREGNTLYESERNFQRETIQKEMDSHRELTEGEINTKIESQNVLLEQAEQKYGKMFCGRVPVSTLREIANDRIKGYLDFYQKDSKMKGILHEVEGFMKVKYPENKLMENLEKYQEELSEKMLDDDSVDLVNKYTAITNILNDYYAMLEAPDPIDEAFEHPDLYQTPYELAQKQYDDVSKVLRGIDKESEPELYKLGENALIGLKNIREAIANEAYKNTEEGIESLKKDSSLAAVTAFSIIMKTEPGSELRKKLEEVGADKVIKDANKSEPVKSSKKKLDIRSIGKALNERNGFKEFIKESPAAQVKSNDKKIEDPSLENPALGGSGGPGIGGN